MRHIARGNAKEFGPPRDRVAISSRMSRSVLWTRPPVGKLKGFVPKKKATFSLYCRLSNIATSPRSVADFYVSRVSHSDTLGKGCRPGLAKVQRVTLPMLLDAKGKLWRSGSGDRGRHLCFVAWARAEATSHRQHHVKVGAISINLDFCG